MVSSFSGHRVPPSPSTRFPCVLFLIRFFHQVLCSHQVCSDRSPGGLEAGGSRHGLKHQVNKSLLVSSSPWMKHQGGGDLSRPRWDGVPAGDVPGRPGEGGRDLFGFWLLAIQGHRRHCDAHLGRSKACPDTRCPNPANPAKVLIHLNLWSMDMLGWLLFHKSWHCCVIFSNNEINHSFFFNINRNSAFLQSVHICFHHVLFS